MLFRSGARYRAGVPGRLVRRGEKQQKQCPFSVIFGRGSAAFGTAHDDAPVCRAHSPPPSFSTAPLQDHLKDWELIRHSYWSRLTSFPEWLSSRPHYLAVER